MTPCLLISSYPKFLRNLLLGTRKMVRKVLSSDTVSYPAIWMCVLQLCSTVLTSDDEHLHAGFIPCHTYSQTNRITWQPTAVMHVFFLSPVHSLCSFFLYLSTVRSSPRQPFQGEKSGYMRLPCETQTVWCLLGYELPLRLASPATVRSSMPTYSSLWRLWSVNVVNG